MALVGALLLDGARRKIDPDVAIAKLDREGAHVVGKLVEGAAGGEVEAGVVPMAGEDAIFDSALAEGETHVGAAVVHSEDLAAGGEEGEGVALGLDAEAAGGG